MLLQKMLLEIYKARLFTQTHLLLLESSWSYRCWWPASFLFRLWKNTLLWRSQ